MKIQRYKSADMRTVMQKIQHDHGIDAVIVSREKCEKGVVVIAAVDYDDTLYQQIKGENNNPLWLDSYCQKNGVDVDAGVINIAASMQSSGASIDELDLMRMELQAMRDSLDQHLVGATNNQISLQHPHLSKVLMQLKKMGFSDKLAQQVSLALADKNINKNILAQALKQLMQIIPIQISAHNNTIEAPTILAFVGPTGAGKTTGLAKVAAHLLLSDSTATVQNMAFVCCDTSRIGAFEQLNVFGKILGIPVYRAANKDELEQQLDQLKNKKHVFIDTEGFCKRQNALPDAIAMLRDTSHDIKSYLVLSADMQQVMMHEAYSLYQEISPQAVVLSKLDEAIELGTAISAVVEHRLPLAYLSNGQEVPDSLSAASAAQLINCCLNLFKTRLQGRQNISQPSQEYVLSEAV